MAQNILATYRSTGVTSIGLNVVNTSGSATMTMSGGCVMTASMTYSYPTTDGKFGRRCIDFLIELHHRAMHASWHSGSATLAYGYAANQTAMSLTHALTSADISNSSLPYGTASCSAGTFPLT